MSLRTKIKHGIVIEPHVNHSYIERYIVGTFLCFRSGKYDENASEGINDIVPDSADVDGPDRGEEDFVRKALLKKAELAGRCRNCDPSSCAVSNT